MKGGGGLVLIAIILQFQNCTGFSVRGEGRSRYFGEGVGVVGGAIGGGKKITKKKKQKTLLVEILPLKKLVEVPA